MLCLSFFAFANAENGNANTGLIKGLQVQEIADAIDLGIHHATLNVNLTDFDDLGQVTPLTVAQTQKVEALKKSIQKLNAANIKTYLILLVYPRPKDQTQPLLLHPHHDPKLDFTVGAMNTSSEAGIHHVQKVISTLCSQLNQSSKLQLEGFIVSNEVNSSKPWNNLGEATLSEAVDPYEKAVRTIYTSTRSEFPHSKVYLSLDHFWSTDMHEGRLPKEFYPGKSFLLEFAKLTRTRGDFPWHLAYHPYPENLFNPRTWADQSAGADENTSRITFKNIEVLCQFMQKEELLWQQKPRRIILSEQGLHSENTEEGLDLQATAFVYAWNKVSTQPMIDAFIWHRHVDHAQEGGLNLGLWTRKKDSILTPDQKKPIYKLFKAAETPDWPKSSAPYLKKLERHLQKAENKR